MKRMEGEEICLTIRDGTQKQDELIGDLMDVGAGGCTRPGIEKVEYVGCDINLNCWKCCKKIISFLYH